MTELTMRMASLSDAEGIWGLLRQVSADIPFRMEEEAEQESMLSEMMACCTSGLSPIVTDKQGKVVGALLARRDDLEWGLRNREAVHVAYAAVTPDLRGADVLARLFAALQGRNVSILASVKAGERQGLADGLGKLGFVHEATAGSGWGDLYQWTPAAA